MPLLSTRRQRLTSSVVAVFALAATAGWFTQADAQSGRRNQTPPIVACDGEDVLPRAGVSVDTGALPDLDLAVQTIARENATTQELTLARDSCARARVNRNRHALVAYQCVANAQNRLAASERAQRQYERAYCANQAVVVLTEPSRAASRSEVNRDAHKSVGDALMSLRDIFGAGSTTGATMLSAAVREYEAAVNGQNDTSAARHFALGRAYRESGNLTGANTQMSNGSNRPIANAQEADQAGPQEGQPDRGVATARGVDRERAADEDDHEHQPHAHAPGDAAAQAEQGAKSGGQADRQQADRSGLLNGQTEPEDQQRHTNDATAGAGQGKDQPDDGTEQRGHDCRIDRHRHRQLRSC